MTPDQIATLVPLYTKKFIQRPDVVAIQTPDGGYKPLRDWETKKPNAKFNRALITDHLTGRKTYGHYLLDQNSMTKLFVLDIDLTKWGFLPTQALNMTDRSDEHYQNWVRSFIFVPDLRAAWHSRSLKLKPARDYIKYQLRILGNTLASSVHSLLGINTAVAYTGNKGIHVYGFTGPVSASDAVDAAGLVMESVKIFAPLRGDNFYADTRRTSIPLLSTGEPDPDWVARWTDGPPATFDPNYFHNLHVEVFPKQRSIASDGLGNLVRLPLGKNLHAPSDPTFFLDLAASLTEFKAVDPVFALTTDNPWQTPKEAGF